MTDACPPHADVPPPPCTAQTILHEFDITLERFRLERRNEIHSFAVALAEARHDLAEIQEFLGVFGETGREGPTLLAMHANQTYGAMRQDLQLAYAKLRELGGSEALQTVPRHTGFDDDRFFAAIREGHDYGDVGAGGVIRPVAPHDPSSGAT